MLNFLISVLGCLAIHLLTIAVTAHLVGVEVRVVSLGFGPTLLKIGIFRLGALPIGGYVKLQDSREEPVPDEEMRKSIDGRSTTEQVVISLSGCVALLLVALALLGAAGWNAFAVAPVQILRGAISPFFEAQALISEGAKLSATASLAVLFGYTAAKLTALNILPLPAFNGGAVLAILGQRLKLTAWWNAGATQILLFLTLGILASWCVAALTYVAGA